MNAPLTTRAGEGFDRKAWTVEDLRTLVDAGLMDEDSPFELIEGELLAVSPKYLKHELWKRNLARMLIEVLPRPFAVAVEPTLFLDDVSAPEPDVLVHDGRITSEDVRGPDVLLLAEVTDSSRVRDLGLKARLYARHGVAHYWVLDAERRQVITHAEPRGDGYARVETHELGEELSLPFRPEARLRLSDLDLP